MPRGIRLLLQATAVWAASPAACGAAASDPTSTPKIVAAVGTVVGSLLVGMLLYQLAQRSSEAKFKDPGRDADATGRRQRGGQPETLLPTILDELVQLQGSPEQRQRVAKSVSEIVTQAVEEQVGTARKELDERYSRVVEEGRRSQAVLQRRYDTTLQEKKQTVAVLESIAEGLVVINNKGDVIMMNPAAEKLLAVDRPGRLGQPLLDNLRDEQMVSLVHHPNEQDREIVLSAKQDSTKRVLRASNAVVTDEDGNTVGIVAVLSDVTKQRELDELKSEFVSRVSHELRTPMVAMQHALAILTDQVAGPMTEEQQKFSGIVQRNLERLNALISDLLDLSKLEAKKTELHLESVAVAALIAGICESLDPWARSKGLTITKRVAESVPGVVCDKGRITQVLTNLIGNAIKFTPHSGRITIEAKLGQDRAVEISVSDTGIGIAKEDLPKLFSKFQQVGERTASDMSGTGLGLVIAKEIVELHHGRIWADSELKRGARFAFTLPVEPPASSAPPPSR